MEVNASGKRLVSGMKNSTRHLLTITLTLTLTGKKTSYLAHSLLCIIIIIIILIKLFMNRLMVLPSFFAVQQFSASRTFACQHNTHSSNVLSIGSSEAIPALTSLVVLRGSHQYAHRQASATY